jgi:diacylglycerol kinase
MLKRHLASYRYALRGIWMAFRFEPNMVFHLFGAIAVMIANYALKISATDWILTLLLIGAVWMSEIFNTAIEKLADRVTREHDSLIGQAKDLAAGAVLIMSTTAAICGALIYIPYLRALL